MKSDIYPWVVLYNIKMKWRALEIPTILGCILQNVTCIKKCQINKRWLNFLQIACICCNTFWLWIQSKGNFSFNNLSHVFLDQMLLYMFLINYLIAHNVGNKSCLNLFITRVNNIWTNFFIFVIRKESLLYNRLIVSDQKVPSDKT